MTPPAVKRHRIAAGLALAIALSAIFATIFFKRAALAARKTKSEVDPPGPRYVVTWADGSQSLGREFEDWDLPGGKPTFEGHPLFDSNNPVRTILDIRLESEDAESFVEFGGGDQLPGRVVAYEDNDQAGVRLGPPRLIVDTPINFDLPGLTGRGRIPVALESVRRIVHGAATFKPVEKNTLLHVDGRHLAYRAARWKADSLELLTDSGITRIEFDEIADMALPAADDSDAMLRELATLTPQLKSRLMRIETDSGLRATCSLERLLPNFDPRLRVLAPKLRNQQRWVHIIQPAWSLEPLGVGNRTVCGRVFFAPQEVLLSRLRPVASRHYGVFSAAWTTCRRDRNVEGNPLMCEGKRSLWGLGVHAGHELEFELPASATQFRTRLGIDNAAGGGGSVVGRVLVDGKPAFESPLLVGSQPAAAIGPISLKEGALARLTLIADPAYNAPKTADPLDVRDIADWLEPIVRLDSSMLARQVVGASVRAAPGLAGWSAEPPAGATWQLVNRWDTSDRDSPSFRGYLEISAPVTFTLKRRIAPPRDSLLLWIGLANHGSAGRSNFEVSVSGRRLGVDKLPIVDWHGEMRPIVVPLADYAGQNVEISVRLEPTDKIVLVDWRGSAWQEATTEVKSKDP